MTLKRCINQKNFFLTSPGRELKLLLIALNRKENVCYLHISKVFTTFQIDQNFFKLFDNILSH